MAEKKNNKVVGSRYPFSQRKYVPDPDKMGYIPILCCYHAEEE